MSYTPVESERITLGGSPALRTNAAGDDISLAVVGAVATFRGIKPVDLPPLTEAVNPDALNRIFRTRAEGSPRTGGSVSFRYAGSEVTVYADGEIVVTEAA
jgi:hypothetical protein